MAGVLLDSKACDFQLSLEVEYAISGFFLKWNMRISDFLLEYAGRCYLGGVRLYNGKDLPRRASSGRIKQTEWRNLEKWRKRNRKDLNLKSHAETRE
ncbi:hypothetical protein RhiirA4_485478 [Rhizophagus irregularis]|uniref:Uncharacterized protein n=1 Tax=Rhizophagus irregularis TaxID=588596 RepID=A0A2I1HQF6_9GLOM|nr:hypothetical protein RhiirA4_485478 [Rhizophagus irregularis]